MFILYLFEYPFYYITKITDKTSVGTTLCMDYPIKLYILIYYTLWHNIKLYIGVNLIPGHRTCRSVSPDYVIASYRFQQIIIIIIKVSIGDVTVSLQLIQYQMCFSCVTHSFCTAAITPINPHIRNKGWDRSRRYT